MRLIHYSSYPELKLRSRPHQGVGFKPAGLWVSVEGKDDWPSWCRAENFAVDRLTHAFEIDLRADADVLYLSSTYQLDDFTKTYRATRAPLRDYINWSLVSETYQGIVIAPYQWERRMSLLWYYGFDCASGCIWDGAAIRSICKLEEVKS